MRGVLKLSCFGCLMIVGVVLLVSAIASGVAWQAVRNEEVSQRSLSRELPEPEAVQETRVAGRVVLDLSNGEFVIEPAEADEPVHVEATFDTKSYDLDESWSEAEDGSWVYEVSFSQQSSGMMSILKSLFGASSPRVEVRIPPDVPIALEGTLKRCGAEVDVGGLWLTELDLDLNQGGVMFDVDEPTREPLDRMRISTAMGGVQLRSLGNASPRLLELDVRMAGLDVDLRGRWTTDSDIAISHRMAGAQVQLPRDVVIEGLEGRRFGLEPSPERTVPVLTIRADTTSGDLEFTH